MDGCFHTVAPPSCSSDSFQDYGTRGACQTRCSDDLIFCPQNQAIAAPTNVPSSPVATDISASIEQPQASFVIQERSHPTSEMLRAKCNDHHDHSATARTGHYQPHGYGRLRSRDAVSVGQALAVGPGESFRARARGRARRSAYPCILRGTSSVRGISVYLGDCMSSVSPP
jgi:hypothetical protein